MGFLDILHGVAKVVHEKAERTREAYDDAMELNDEELRRRLKSGWLSSDQRKGYIKAAQERGLIRR